jgi:hypothetical protein
MCSFFSFFAVSTSSRRDEEREQSSSFLTTLNPTYYYKHYHITNNNKYIRQRTSIHKLKIMGVETTLELNREVSAEIAVQQTEALRNQSDAILALVGGGDNNNNAEEDVTEHDDGDEENHDDVVNKEKERQVVTGDKNKDPPVVGAVSVGGPGSASHVQVGSMKSDIIGKQDDDTDNTNEVDLETGVTTIPPETALERGMTTATAISQTEMEDKIRKDVIESAVEAEVEDSWSRIKRHFWPAFIWCHVILAIVIGIILIVRRPWEN